MKVTIDYIEALNQYFENRFPNKGHFILKVTKEQNKTIKAYWTYTLSLYHYYKGSNDLITQYSNTGKVINGNFAQLEEDTHLIMLKSIFLTIDKINELGGKSISDSD